jgi:ABC-2 type transport system ATP-binding protein
MKQRLGIAQAMVNAPRLLLLDEPTSALDPIGRLEVLDMIAALRGRTTVFFSTHILADVERVCDTVAILDRGAVVAGGRIDELKQRYATKRIAVELDGTPAPLALRLAGRAWLTRLEESSSTLRLTVNDVDAAREDIIAALAESRLPLRRFEVEAPTLEEVFVELLAPGRQ